MVEIDHDGRLWRRRRAMYRHIQRFCGQDHLGLGSSSSSGRQQIAVVFFRYDAKSDEESIRNIPFNRIMPDAVSRPANQPKQRFRGLAKQKREGLGVERANGLADSLVEATTA